MAAPYFFTVNGGKVNCARVEYQAELPRIVAEMLGVLEPKLGVIDGLDRLAKCGPTTPDAPCELWTFGDLQITEFEGKKHAVVPLDRIDDYIIKGWTHDYPAASNYYIHGQDIVMCKYHDPQLSYIDHDRIVRNTSYADRRDCYVIVPRKHLKMFEDMEDME